jgi:hypothetical protein
MQISKGGPGAKLGIPKVLRLQGKRIDRPGCRQADSAVNIWTVSLLNSSLIGLRVQSTPVSQVGTGTGLALSCRPSGRTQYGGLQYPSFETE